MADPAATDHRVTHDANAADKHITFGDYVLHYAHKKAARVLRDKSGHERKVLKDTSAWTWKLDAAAMRELSAQMRAEIKRNNLGGEAPASGLVGFLALQRRHPLFSGVRSQALQLHDEARDAWARAHPAQSRQGDGAGQPIPRRVRLEKHLPKMIRLKVFSDAHTTGGPAGDFQTGLE